MGTLRGITCSHKLKVSSKVPGGGVRAGCRVSQHARGLGSVAHQASLGGGGALPFGNDERRCPGLSSWSLRRVVR
jgi:hypothetical protein